MVLICYTVLASGQDEDDEGVWQDGKHGWNDGRFGRYRPCPGGSGNRGILEAHDIIIVELQREPKKNQTDRE